MLAATVVIEAGISILRKIESLDFLVLLLQRTTYHKNYSKAGNLLINNIVIIIAHSDCYNLNEDTHCKL